MPLPTEYQSFIHLSRYGRWDYNKKRRETWEETVERYFNFFEEHLLENNNYENIIVFAPTPLDKSGNKSGTFWQKLILNPSASVDLLKYLCNTYKNYKIYYKPYKDEDIEKYRTYNYLFCSIYIRAFLK